MQLIDFSCHFVKEFTDVVTCLRTDFHIKHFVTKRESVCLFWAYLSAMKTNVRSSSNWELSVAETWHWFVGGIFTNEVILKATENLNNFLGGVALKILKPEVQFAERFLVSQIKANQTSLDIVIVHSGNLAKSFLTSSVPDEKSDHLSRLKKWRIRVILPKLYSFLPEVPAECWLRSMVIEHIFYIALNHACFSHHALPHADHLELLLHFSRSSVNVWSLHIKV